MDFLIEYLQNNNYKKCKNRQNDTSQACMGSPFPEHEIGPQKPPGHSPAEKGSCFMGYLLYREYGS
jgi:hypothetical protein